MARARARLHRPDLPLMTVVADLADLHSWWAAPETDQYVVCTDVLQELAPARAGQVASSRTIIA